MGSGGLAKQQTFAIHSSPSSWESAQLRDASAGERLRHPHDPGAAGSSGRAHDDDLHARPQFRPGSAQSDRHAPAVKFSLLSGIAWFEVQVAEEPKMETAKDEVRRILDALPDDATLEDIQYRLYVRQAIDAGLRDIAESRTLFQEEVE